MKIYHTNKYTILIILLISTIFIINFTTIRFQDIELTDEEGNIRKINLPFLEDSTENKIYIFSGKIYYGRISQNTVKIIPDDRIDYIIINDMKVSFEKIDEKSLGDWKNGFDINLRPYLKTGENTFEIKIYDCGGKFGLNIKHSFQDSLYSFLEFFIIVWICIMAYFVISYLKKLYKRPELEKVIPEDGGSE